MATLEAGTIQELEPGEDIKFSEPADVGNSYEQFERQVLLRIAAGVGMPYDMLTGDLSQTSYSSIRAGILSFRRLCEQIQYTVFIHQFCKPVWRAFIEAAVLAGKLDARDFQANREEYLAVDWHTPKWAWVDPEKDVKAEVIAIRAGLKPRSVSLNEQGMDEETVDAQYAADNERADSYGHVFDSDPRLTDARGAARGTGEADAEEPEPGEGEGKTQGEGETAGPGKGKPENEK
jgi:lambda family phage portal protein